MWAVAEISWEDPTGMPYHAPATTEDTSASGAQGTKLATTALRQIRRIGRLTLQARRLVKKGKLWNPKSSSRISGVTSKTKTRPAKPDSALRHLVSTLYFQNIN
jgi:hypothetical protein